MGRRVGQGTQERAPGTGCSSATGGRRRPVAGCGCVGVVEHIEDALGGRLPLGAGVELGAGPPEGEVHLRGQDEYGRASAQRHTAIQQSQPQEERDEGGTDRGQHLERERRRNATRSVFMVLARNSSFAVSRVRRPSRCPTERAQGRHALKQVVEGGAPARRVATTVRRRAASLPGRGEP